MEWEKSKHYRRKGNGRWHNIYTNSEGHLRKPGIQTKIDEIMNHRETCLTKCGIESCGTEPAARSRFSRGRRGGWGKGCSGRDRCCCHLSDALEYAFSASSLFDEPKRRRLFSFFISMFVSRFTGRPFCGGKSNTPHWFRVQLKVEEAEPGEDNLATVDHASS